MRKNLALLLAYLLTIAPAAQASQIQQQGIKTAAQCIAAGATIANCLPLDQQIYVTANGINQQLSSAITAGLIGGAGGTNYISNSTFESNATTGYATYKNTAQTTPVSGTGGSPTHITIASSGTNPLQKLYSMVITNSGSTSAQGEGVSNAFTIDAAQEGKTLQIQYDYILNSGTFVGGSSNLSPSDLVMYVYDVTNSVLIQPNSIYLSCSSTTLPCHYASTFPASSNSASYRLIWHVQSTNTAAWALKIDSVSVGPQVTTQGYAASDSVAYTPTITGFGTVSSVSFYSRRVGDHLHVQGVFISGTSTATTAQITLGYNGVNGNVTIDSTKFNGGVVGSGASQTTGTTFFGISPIGGVSANYITIGAQSSTSSAVGAANGSAIAASGSFVDLVFDVPIAGWSSGVNMSANVGTQSVQFLTNNTPSGSPASSSTTILFTSGSVDNLGAYNASTGMWTAPFPVCVNASAYVQIAGLIPVGSNYVIQFYKNAGAVSPTYFITEGNANSQIGVNASIQSVCLNAGDTLSVQGLYQGTVSGASFSGGMFSISSAVNSQVIAASDPIHFKYTTATGTVPNASNTNVVLGTKVEDSSQGGYNPSTGIFTAPAPGEYQFNAFIIYGSTASTLVNCLTLVNLNGSLYGGLNNPKTGTLTTQPSGTYSDLIHLNAGDQVNVVTYQDSGSSNTIAAASFSMARIGN